MTTRRGFLGLLAALLVVPARPRRPRPTFRTPEAAALYAQMVRVFEEWERETIAAFRALL